MRKQHLLLSILMILVLGCYKEEEYTPLAIEPEDVIKSILTTKMSLIANNIDTMMVTAVLPEEARTGLDIVLFTSRGVFVANGTNTITVKSKAVERHDSILVIGEAVLRNGLSVGPIRIDASVNDYLRSIERNSVQNPATRISLSTAALALSNNPTAEVEVTATISTAGGTVSQGQLVQVSAISSTGAPIGTFRVRPSFADGTGQARYIYSLVPDSTYTGAFRIIASTSGLTQTFQDTITLYAID